MNDPGRLFGLPAPIIQAPMAGVATPALAAAVSNAGGLGSLGLGASTVVQAQQLLTETRALTDRPFNVNLFCHQPAEREAEREAVWIEHLAPLFAEVGTEPPAALNEISTSFLVDEAMQRLILELRPVIVSFHFGLPSADYLTALRAAGIRTLATATNQREAAVIEAAGIDAIVAQGIEAGGHRGMFDPGAEDERLSTAVLVRVLTRQTSLPIIAAGGIMDGAGIRAALELGAAGAQLGTAFILCPESAASASYRANLKSERAEVTRLTPVLSGRPARGMVNRLIRHGEAPGSPRPPAFPVAYDAVRQLNSTAVEQGNHEFAAQWAGQGAPLARELPAATLVATLMEEFRARGS
jgi:nitronate monooxygenase